MRLNVLPIKQNGVELYVTTIPALELINNDNFKVDRWSPTGGGYQRELNVPHIRTIARYLQGESNTTTLPTAIVLNSRKPLKPHLSKEGVSTINLSDEQYPLYFTDGQHRVEALTLAHNSGVNLDDYVLPVIVTNFELAEEIQQFRKINTTANKAPRGLDQQLRRTLTEEHGYNRTSEEAAEDRVVQIVTRLVTDSSSPWFERVALGGQRRTMAHTTVQGTMVRSLLPLFTRGRFANPDMDMNEIYRVIFDFWSAVADNFPLAFETPTKYNIQRGPGLNAWNMVLNQILNINLHPTREVMRDSIAAARNSAHIDDSYWSSGSRGKLRNMIADRGWRQAHNLAADEIWFAMDKGSLRE